MSRKPLFLLSILLLLLTGCHPNKTPAPSTPEQAVQGYLTALISKDYRGALQFYPSKQLEKNFNQTAYQDRIKAEGPLPDFSKMEFLFAYQTGYLPLSFFADELTLSPGTEIDAQWYEEFFASPDMDRIKTLEILRIDAPYNQASQFGLQTKQAHASTANTWGAQGYTQRIALSKFEGETYMLGFTLIQYDNIWWVMDSTCSLVNMPSIGGSTQITEQDYLKWTQR
ncbi:MAG: hypothetical protein ACOYI4_05270 [Christensenellales bacterium]